MAIAANSENQWKPMKKKKSVPKAESGCVSAYAMAWLSVLQRLTSGFEKPDIRQARPAGWNRENRDEEEGVAAWRKWSLIAAEKLAANRQMLKQPGSQ